MMNLFVNNNKTDFNSTETPLSEKRQHWLNSSSLLVRADIEKSDVFRDKKVRTSASEESSLTPCSKKVRTG